MPMIRYKVTVQVGVLGSFGINPSHVSPLSALRHKPQRYSSTSRPC